MIEAWVPVLFAAIIVFGVVGGTLMQMVLKELLPVLRSMAEQRQPIPAADLQRLSATMEAVGQKLDSLQREQVRLAEESEFVQRLLSSRSAADAAADGDRSGSVSSSSLPAPQSQEDCSGGISAPCGTADRITSSRPRTAAAPAK